MVYSFFGQRTLSLRLGGGRRPGVARPSFGTSAGGGVEERSFRGK
jgi:hypothetical protein